MEEQKHTTEIDKLLEQLKQLKEEKAALTKENKQFKADVKRLTEENETLEMTEVRRLRKLVDSLTEQVEKLKERNQILETLHEQHRMYGGYDDLLKALEEVSKDVDAHKQHIRKQNTDISRLREREKELVEALKEALDVVSDEYFTHPLIDKIQSLLSKFHEPNE